MGETHYIHFCLDIIGPIGNWQLTKHAPSHILTSLKYSVTTKHLQDNIK